MDDQSPNARKKNVSANTEAFRFSSVKQDSATGMPGAKICPVHAAMLSRQIEIEGGIPEPEGISDQFQKYYTFTPPVYDRTRMVLEVRKMKVVELSDDGQKARTGQMTIGHPATFTTSICRKVKDAKIIVSSCVNENAKGSSNSDSSNNMIGKVTLHHFCKEEDIVPASSFSATVRHYQDGQEIIAHSSCDENARRDDPITGPVYSGSGESAIDPSTSSQSSARTFPDEAKMTLCSKGEENATELSVFSTTSSLLPDEEDKVNPYSYSNENETESLASLSTSVRMPQGDQEIIAHSSCDEIARRNDMAIAYLYSRFDESAREPSTSSPNSERTFPDANKITVRSKSEENATVPSFSFSPSSLFPDQEDIPYSYNYVNETEPSTPPSATVRSQGDQEITAHSSCDENSRRDDTITGPVYSCSDERTRNTSTSSQSSTRTFSVEAQITLRSKGDENATDPSVSSTTSFLFPDEEDKINPYSYSSQNETESLASISTSVRMPRGDQEITAHSSCDETARRNDMAIASLYSRSDDSAREPSTSTPTSERTFPDANKITVCSEGEKNATVPSFSFSPSSLFPDQEDIPYSYNYENETESSTSLFASITTPQFDEEITVHSSCDENARREEIASGSSTRADESGNLGCTLAQESSHKNLLDKA
ncbi:hypothetical protein AVEN_257308-1 [Araneus ventricosus]|uniref:Uncharacterized protein n=1 Tax=Araneus ventricosus TaxID=182803 RepID=A0A4Y2NM87_ARAVE|nr:hypothetical protein AVEN_257308-1 [Araneus ventricosus]